MDWQQSDSRLQISFLLKEIFSLLARGKRKRKKKEELLALSRDGQMASGLVLIDRPKSNQPSLWR